MSPGAGSDHTPQLPAGVPGGSTVEQGLELTPGWSYNWGKFGKEGEMVKATAKLAGLIVLIGATVASGAWTEDEKYSVAAIHAHLYYQSTGEINPEDLLDGKAHALWNTIIGGGEARKPSCAILVLVDLTGPTFVNIGGKLAMKATEGEKTLLDQTLSLGIWFNEGQKLVLPFLVYGTGCGKLEITATLQGLPASKVKTAALKKLVPFECGE